MDPELLEPVQWIPWDAFLSSSTLHARTELKRLLSLGALGSIDHDAVVWLYRTGLSREMDTVALHDSRTPLPS